MIIYEHACANIYYIIYIYMFEYVWMVEYVCLPEHSLTYMFMIVCYMWWGMLMNHQCSVLNRFQPQVDGEVYVPKPCLKCSKRWFDFKH